MNFGNIVIFGDSYSTFRGWLPEGFAYSYSEDGTDGNEVIDVRDTWWHLLVNKTDSNLVMNNSWSGSTICYTGYFGKDCSETNSFLYRFLKWRDEGFFEENKIDTVFVFGGTNDTWAKAPVGKLQYGDWKKEDLFSVLPAVCRLFYELKSTLPEARIVCLVNTYLDAEIEAGMIEAAKHYGVETVVFDNIDKVNGHPTIKGMKDICDGILNTL